MRWLLDAGLERVAYVDLDVHHGNGTQWIFYDEPRVLTVSDHESGRPLFPGSGLRARADEACDGRLVALGGGGYEPCTPPPRAWAGLAAELAGTAVEGPVPEGWRRVALEAGCPEPARGWWDDPGPAPDPERDRLAAGESEAAIAQSLLALSRFHDLSR